MHVDYGSVSNPVQLMQCAWVRNNVSVHGGTNYKRDKDDFLVVDFHEIVANIEAIPFVFPL